MDLRLSSLLSQEIAGSVPQCLNLICIFKVHFIGIGDKNSSQDKQFRNTGLMKDGTVTPVEFFMVR